MLENLRDRIVSNPQYTAVETQPEINITVAQKTANHPNFNVGDAMGYVVDGVEGAVIELEAQQTYKITVQNVACDYALYFTSSAVGGSNSVGELFGIGTPAIRYVCNDTSYAVESFYFTPISAQTFFYQSRYRPSVGFQVVVIDPISDTTSGNSGTTTGSGTTANSGTPAGAASSGTTVTAGTTSSNSGTTTGSGTTSLNKGTTAVTISGTSGTSTENSGATTSSEINAASAMSASLFFMGVLSASLF